MFLEGNGHDWKYCKYNVTFSRIMLVIRGVILSKSYELSPRFASMLIISILVNYETICVFIVCIFSIIYIHVLYYWNSCIRYMFLLYFDL